MQFFFAQPEQLNNGFALKKQLKLKIYKGKLSKTPLTNCYCVRKHTVCQRMINGMQQRFLKYIAAIVIMVTTN